MKNITKLFFAGMIALFLFMNLFSTNTKTDISFFIATKEKSSYDDVPYDDNIDPLSINITTTI